MLYHDSNRYLKKLLRSYYTATGIDKIDKNFIEWMMNNQENIKLYKSLLNDMSIEYDNPSIAEVGKGPLDSITIDNISNSTIITPFFEAFTSINSQDKAYEGNNYQTTNKRIMLTNFVSILNMKNISRFFTQNPTLEEIALFTKLHQQNNDITIGIYGNITDCDLESKSVFMNQICKSLSSDYEEKAMTINSTYLHVISSKRRVLKK